MKKPPLRKPPKKDLDLDQLDKFASKGEAPRDEKPPKPKPVYPWQEPGVRADVISGMGVPLSEPYLLKLRYIAQNTKWSQRKFCKVRLEAAIDREINKLIQSEPGQTEPD